MSRSLLPILLSGLLLSACGTPSDNTSSQSAAESSSSSSVPFTLPEIEIPGDPFQGEQQYQQNCAVCHGEKGEGRSQLNSPSLIGCSVCEDPTRLSDYIDVAMPPGGPAAAQACADDCAINVSAYIVSEFNGQVDLSACETGTTPEASVFKRLSRLEYRNTLMDLFQLTSAPDVSAIPDDPSVYNFQTIASVQSIQPSHLNGYISVATDLAEDLMASTARRSQVLGCSPDASTCLENFVRRFGRLAFRRPLTDLEVTRISQYAYINAGDANDQYVMAMQLMLTSPNFIYRVEVGNTPEGLSTLNSYELAARLAFALWGRGPDSALLDKAAAGELDSEQGLRQVAEDMLNDPKAKENMVHFFEQWLATNLLKAPVETPENWYPGILQDMKDETNKLLGEYVWQDKDFMQVFTENRTYLTPSLANYYGMPQPNSSDGTVSLPSGDPRAHTGILTHAANMFGKSDGDLIAKRGNWLRSTFLCKELHLPDSVTDIINGKFAGYTPMEIITERNRDEACERCHAQIDPIGIAFAPFNRAGLFDPSVHIGDYPVSPGFPDTGDASVQTVQQIAEELSNMPEVGQCLADRLFLYMRNQVAENDDRCAIYKANERFHNSGRKFASLLLAMVEDPGFRKRQAPKPEEQSPENEAPLQNLALGKSVSTSQAQDGNPGSRITDDSITGDSRWSAQFYPQNATIDLGRIYSIVQTEIFPYEDRAYRYTIETSTDGFNFSQLVDRSGNTQGGNSISDLFAPQDARYVRITILGANEYQGGWASLREMRVYGTER